jgi:CrcB protein
MRLVLIGVAGAAGALARYGIGVAVGERSFPWATLAINVVGSFVLALLLTLAIARSWSPDLVVPIGVGLLGAFTTFSTFSWDALTMGRGDRIASATTYVLATVVLGLLAAFLGFRTGEALG